jgi:hypothetical protein
MTGILLAGAWVVGALAVALVGVVSLEVLLRWPEAGVALVLGATVMQAALLEQEPSLTLPVGISVKFHDVIFALLLTAGIARFLRFRRLTPLQRVLMLLGFMLLLSLIRGILVFGQHSVSEFRLFSPLISTAIYFSSFPPSTVRNDRIGKIWLALTMPIVVLICLRWAQNFGGVNLGVPMEKFGTDAVLRVVNGPYGFFIGTSVMLTVPYWQQRDERSRKLRWIGWLLLLVVVLLDRRTVWITLLVGVAVVLLRNRKLGHRAISMVTAAGIVAVGVFVALQESGAETAGGIRPEITSPLMTDTLTWRTEGWSTLLEGWSANPVNWVIGERFGSGFARDVGGNLVASTTDPHNFYITTLLRTGVVGMLAFIVLAVGLLRALWRQDSATTVGLFAPSIFPALLVTQLVWFVTWSPGNEVGIIIGLALASATARLRGSPTVRSQTPSSASSAAPRAAPGVRRRVRAYSHVSTVPTGKPPGGVG